MRIGDFFRDLWRWVTGQGGGVPYGSSGRTYHFRLPRRLSAMEVHYAIPFLEKAGLWASIPSDLREKLKTAHKKWHPVTVTASDLDRLDDRTLTYIGNKLGLKWSK